MSGAAPAPRAVGPNPACSPALRFPPVRFVRAQLEIRLVRSRQRTSLWLELRRLPPNSAPDSGVIFHAAAGVGPPRTDIRKSEEKLHLKDSHQTRTGRAQRGPLDGMLS